MFSGTVKITICEASCLRPTDFQKRHNVTFGKPDDQLIDPYVTIDIDDNFCNRSTTKQKTFDPVWNESFVEEVQNASKLEFTVFHDAVITPDFIANCTVTFEELTAKEKDLNDLWVIT